MKPIIQVTTLIAICLSCSQLQAELVLPHIISDNMMLQRDKPVRIWGWENPGATITVEFAGQKKTASADSSGEWLATLDPMPSSGEGRSMTIAQGDERRTIQNILVGEVWQAAGQSNMQFSLMGETHWPEAEQYPANDQIRLFKQERNPQGTPATQTLKAIWVVDEGLISSDGEALSEFTICGDDKNFVPATAEIVDDTIVVSSSDVGKPVAVRYAWKNAPIDNRERVVVSPW